MESDLNEGREFECSNDSDYEDIGFLLGGKRTKDKSININNVKKKKVRKTAFRLTKPKSLQINQAKKRTYAFN